LPADAEYKAAGHAAVSDNKGQTIRTMADHILNIHNANQETLCSCQDMIRILGSIAPPAP